MVTFLTVCMTSYIHPDTPVDLKVMNYSEKVKFVSLQLDVKEQSHLMALFHSFLLNTQSGILPKYRIVFNTFKVWVCILWCPIPPYLGGGWILKWFHHIHLASLSSLSLKEAILLLFGQPLLLVHFCLLLLYLFFPLLHLHLGHSTYTSCIHFTLHHWWLH